MIYIITALGSEPQSWTKTPLCFELDKQQAQDGPRIQQDTI